MSAEHVITLERDVIWSAGPGREAFALAGGTPDPLLDRRTAVQTGWSCTCGVGGVHEVGAQAHFQQVSADLGLAVSVHVRESGR